MSAFRRGAVALYRAAAAFLPPGARDDRHAMAATFEEMLEAAGGVGPQVRTAVSSLTGLAVVVVVEWVDVVTNGAEGPRTGRMTMGLGRDLRYALRTLRRAPAFAVFTVLLLGMGVGAATTIFTLVDHVILRPLPYPEPDRILYVERASHSGPFYRAIQGMETVASWTAARVSDVTLGGEGDPLLLEQARVDASFFPLFGAQAVRGRLLTPADDGTDEGVVLGHRFWRDALGADPDVVGRTLRIDDEPVVVLGVLEPGFQTPEAMAGRDPDLWRSMDWADPMFDDHGYHALRVSGRLAQGVSADAAKAELDAVVARLAVESSNYQEEDGSPADVPLTPLADVTVEEVRTGLGLLMGAVALLLLVACANVAHLFLARGLGRVKEMAVRRAMGAGGATLTRQLLVESLVVAAAGGVVGTGLAWLGLQGFVALNPTALPRQAAVELDLRVLAFALAVSGLTALVFGLVPALRSVRGEVGDELRGGSRGATSGRGVANLRSLLIVGEVAMSLVLVAGAGLLVRSFVGVRAQETGFDQDGIWTVPLAPTGLETPEQYRAIMDEVVRAAGEVPGVASVGYGLTMPMEMSSGGRCCWRTRFTGPELPEDAAASVHPVSRDVLVTLGVDLVAGRTWTQADVAAEPIPVVVGEPLAQAWFGGAERALGQVMEMNRGPVEVVGVAADTKYYGLEYEHGPHLYIPVEQLPWAIPRAHLAVRLRPGADAAPVRALREAVWSAAPSVPVPVVRSMEEWVDRSTAGRRFESALFTIFAGIAMVLAASGLYGTLLFVAGERRRELGIRLALGASRGRIERRLLRSGVTMAGLGIAVGLAGAWWAGALLESRVWGVEPGSPGTLLGAAAALLLTAVVASWLPARRAGRTDPLEALRAE